MKILITGHKGFIGNLLFTQLKWHTDDLIGIDVRDGLNLLTCELPKDVDVIYHLAAQSDVVNSWKDPLHDLDNIRITARLAHAYPKAKIIYANSCAAMDKKSPYGFSKAAAAEYLERFHGNTVNLVFPNIYGKGSRSVVDIFKSQEHVTIYGTGKQTRDYVHVYDIIQGLILAAKWKKGTYYMGSGKSTSVLQLAKGKKITFAPARKEPFEVKVKNTTPNWEPVNELKNYL